MQSELKPFWFILEGWFSAGLRVGPERKPALAPLCGVTWGDAKAIPVSREAVSSICPTATRKIMCPQGWGGVGKRRRPDPRQISEVLHHEADS